MCNWTSTMTAFVHLQAKEKTQPRQKMLCHICSSFSLFIVSQDVHSIQELVHDGDRIYMRQTRVRRGPITWVDHTLGGGPSYMFCGSIQIGSAVVNDFFFVKPPNQWPQPPFCHLICKRSYNRKCTGFDDGQVTHWVSARAHTRCRSVTCLTCTSNLPR